VARGHGSVVPTDHYTLEPQIKKPRLFCHSDDKSALISVVASCVLLNGRLNKIRCDTTEEKAWLSYCKKRSSLLTRVSGAVALKYTVSSSRPTSFDIICALRAPTPHQCNNKKMTASDILNAMLGNLPPLTPNVTNIKSSRAKAKPPLEVRDPAAATANPFQPTRDAI
jgi:hypothetical protein